MNDVYDSTNISTDLQEMSQEWPTSRSNSLTLSDWDRIWGDVSEFLSTHSVASYRSEDISAATAEEGEALEDVLDDSYKVQLRLHGHQKQPHYTGHSMMYIEWRHSLHKGEPNPIMTVNNRPVLQSGPHQMRNVTAIDNQLDFSGLWREAELSKRDQWETIPEYLLENGKLLSWRWQRFHHQMEGVFEVPSIATMVTKTEDDSADKTGKPASWFRWGGRYYNPAYLYTMKHDKEFCFQVWSTRESHDMCVKQLPTQKRICRSSAHKAEKTRTTVCSWTTPRRVTHILCHGESPTILRFPDEYIPSKNNPKKQKRARRKKTRGKSLSIVTNPNHLGYVTTFRVFYFHAQVRKWINLGVFPGNADAKTWVAIDLTAYNVVTNRVRVEPVHCHGSGAFEIEVWGPGDTASTPSETKNPTLEPVLYEITWPTTTEMRPKIWKSGSHWNAFPADSKGYGIKSFYSERRGKQARYAFQRECQDFILT